MRIIARRILHNCNAKDHVSRFIVGLVRSKPKRVPQRTLRIDHLSAGMGDPRCWLQGCRSVDRLSTGMPFRQDHRLSAIIGLLSALRRNPVRLASDSAPRQHQRVYA